jgi:hypothetical protein
MKKIVRLTESDLVRLVKRVIKEESAAIGLPIFIKMMPTKHVIYKADDGYGPLAKFYNHIGFHKASVIDYNPILVNVIRRTSDESQGCVFTAMVKGQSDQIKLRMKCEPGYDSALIVEIITKVGSGDKEESIYFDVSKEAMAKLKTACACSAYVSNQNKDSVPPVGNSNSYV